MRKSALLLVLSVIAILSIGYAYAAEPGGATISNNSTEGEFAAPTAGQINVISGNITTTNLATNQSTFRWTALLGNVSGNIILGDDDSNTLYQWTANGTLVYASNGTVTWSSLVDADYTTVTDRYTFLASGSGSDDYNSTFNYTSAISIGSNIFSLTSDYAVTETTGTSDWRTFSLTDGTEIVWAGQVVEDGSAYRAGTTVDYQMIIPEDGTSNDQTPTEYNLWVELQ